MLGVALVASLARRNQYSRMKDGVAQATLFLGIGIIITVRQLPSAHGGNACDKKYRQAASRCHERSHDQRRLEVLASLANALRHLT